MKTLRLIALATMAMMTFEESMARYQAPGTGSHRSNNNNDDDDSDDARTKKGPFQGLAKYISEYKASQPKKSTYQSQAQNSRRDNDDRPPRSGFGQEDGGNSSMMNSAREAIKNYVDAGGTGLNGARPSSQQNRSLGKCYRHVKYILKDSGCVEDHELGGGAAKGAGSELLAAGFQRVQVSSAQNAPKGSVVVYQCGQYGHIEWRGTDGKFYSDFASSSAHGCRDFKVYTKRGC